MKRKRKGSDRIIWGVPVAMIALACFLLDLLFSVSGNPAETIQEKVQNNIDKTTSYFHSLYDQVEEIPALVFEEIPSAEELLDSIPEYYGAASVDVNSGVPFFWKKILRRIVSKRTRNLIRLADAVLPMLAWE